jgi:pilus assembly protein CpaC
LVISYVGGSVSNGNPESALVGTDSKPFTSIITDADKVTFTETHVFKGYIMGGANSADGSPGADSTRGVVNLLKVRDSQQVRLEVRIAQVSKTYLDYLGLSAIKNWGNPFGSLNNITTGFVSNATLDLLLGQRNPIGQKQYGIKMVARHKPMLFRILAEPTIVTMSGKEGYFLVGGKIFIPTDTNIYNYNNLDVVGKATYIERTYGVGLRFMPVVLDAGRISLKVVSEFSEPNTEPITAGTATTLPSFKISTVSTSVQMNEGENLVIGGLTLDNLTNMTDGVPLLSEIPILGALFRNAQRNNEKIELMVIIRPTLVKGSTTMPELPTDKVVPPTRGELFIGGKLEGSRVK